MKVQKSTPWVKLAKKDWLVMGITTLIYAIIAFVNLGSTESAHTYMTLEDRQQVIVEFDEPSAITRVQIVPGPTRRSHLDFYFADEKREVWHGPYGYSYDGAFDVLEMSTLTSYDPDGESFPENSKFSYAIIESNSEGLGTEGGVDRSTLAEVVFRDSNDEVIPIASFAFYDPITEESPGRDEIDGYYNLFDEQTFVPADANYLNSPIFDEIYYNQTIKNFYNGEAIFETTHPHVGKYIMMVGAEMFGFNTFGWRFMGALLGVLMLPLIYIFAKQIFKKRFWCVFATIVFAFDFMHFTQSRLATIDTYPTFFVMLMFLFMYRYTQVSFYDTKFRRSIVPLFWSGLFFGLGFASKWPVAYGAIGLAVIFFAVMIQRFRERRAFGKAKLFWKNFWKTCAAATAFFVIVPAAIYVISFIPEYVNPRARLATIADVHREWYDTVDEAKEAGHDFDIFTYTVRRTEKAFRFHADLRSPHPYSATWSDWVTDRRPILYYIDYNDDEKTVSTISAFGNPAVWWMGLVAMAYGVAMVLKMLVKKLAGTVRDNDYKVAKIASFMLVGYLAQLLPWVVVERVTFIYHYFPCIIFLVLMTTLMFKEAHPLWWYKFKWLE